MANYTTLKDAIEQVITTNGNNEITGAVLRQTLLSMINSLGANYQFVGIATSATNPGTPDQNVFYLAGPGTYPNFNNAVVNDGQLGVLKFNGSWVAETVIVGKNYDKLIGVYMDNVITQPSKVYIDSSMVNPGDVLYFELESINNLQGVLRAEKTGYVFDQYILVGAGERATVQYTVPNDFLRILTASTANPMRVIICRNQYANKTLYEDIQNLPTYPTIEQNFGNSENALMSQKSITREFGTPVIIKTNVSGWSERVGFLTEQNVGFRVRNLGIGTISFISIWNENDVQLQEFSVSIAPNQIVTLTPNVSGSKIRFFANGACSVNFYNYQTIIGELQKLSDTLVKKTEILQDTGSRTDALMSQKATTMYADSPFSVVVPESMKGFVAFRMNNVDGNNMPVDNYTQFRISAIYMGGAWNIFVQMQKTIDGVNWTNYDTIERLASAAPSPLPVIEEITSKYGAFTVIINWPMMGSISNGSASYILKKNAPGYYERKLQEQISTINLWPTWNDYELKDRTKHILKVDASGNGDFTTIAAAYASISDSAYDNQYEIVVYPGTYQEYNLIPPKFTHTHGLIPNTVIVTSDGITSTLPVFDQRVPCKLSNMTIISGTGYCVHQDQSTLNFTMLINENLHCKKVYGQDVSNFKFRSITNPAILGIGSHLYGAKFIWNNCVFENGQVAAHTVGGNETTPANQHLIYRNCKLVNAYVHLLAVGASSKVGNFVCEIDGLFTEIGRPSVVCQIGERSTGDTRYNFAWQIIGSKNKNFVVITLNSADTLTNDVWPNVNTGDITFVQLASGVSVSKGQFVDIDGNICTGATIRENIVGIALEDGASGATVRVCTGSFAYNNAFNSASFPVVTNDGNYGIGSDGRLLKDATNIIGRIKYNNFYYI